MKRPKARQMTPTRKPANPGVGRAPQRDVGEIRHGTVGWEDGGDHFDLESEGVPLVKVTLFASHNTELQGQNKTPGRAKGLQILARFDGRASDIPDDGEHVLLARPAGMATTPGSYYIFGRTMPDPKWTPNRKSGEKIIFGPNDSFIRFKQDGTIFLFCKSGDADTGKPVQIELSPDGFRVNHPHGEAYCDTDGWGFNHSSGAKVSGGAAGLPAPFDVLGSFVNVQADILRLRGAVVSMGADAGQDNLLKAIPILAALTAMQAEIVALRACITGVASDLLAVLPYSAGPTPPPATGIAALATDTAILAATTALAAASAAGPAQSVTGS